MKNAKQEEQVVVGKWVKQYQAKTWKAEVDKYTLYTVSTL